uniref:Uncharacterized protein n=1 Tax=Solibacter usitatus (strain Ellin6076) TaxID=234267 RepID=Q01V46_SOLUE
MKSTNPQPQCARFRKLTVNSFVMATALAMATGVCSAADSIGVSCALPYTLHHPDPFFPCVGQHTVQYSTSNTDANAKVTAELLALDGNGNLINSFTVHNGENVELASRLSQTAWRFVPSGGLPQVYAPVPLLHVTVEDRGLKAEAYCSDIPYVQVIQPRGGVVSESDGNNTNVLVAIPLTNPGSLHLFVDGVDILTQVPNSFACLPNVPCNGTVTINGQVVGYSNLIIDVASAIDKPASNTVRVTLTNLACGGHIFRVSSVKLPGVPQLVAGVCNADSLSKAGTSSVFSISITDPTPLKITPIIPTPVAGQVCGGTQITNVSINGKNLSVAGETFTPGNGTTSGDVYKVAINTTLDKTDLVRDAFGAHDAPLGTLDAGSNRLAASAKDVNGNRTYKNLIFATGSVAPVAIDPNAKIFQTAAMETAVSSNLKRLVEAQIDSTFTANAPANTDLQNAFVVGLSASGAQTLFNSLCTAPIKDNPDPTINGLTPGQAFSKKVTAAIKAIPATRVTISSPCSCDPPVNINIKSVNIGTNVACNLTFTDGSFHVRMSLPDVHVVADAVGFCKETFLGACVDGAAVGVEGTADVTGIRLDWDVKATDITGTTTPSPILFAGTTATGAHDITNPFGDQGISTCGLSDVCTFLVQIFTFGAVDLTPTINISQVQDFSAQIGATSKDPVKMTQIKVDPTVINNFNQKASGDISEVHITPSGITAGLVGHFASLAVDPSVPATPGVTLTPAPVPPLPVPNAKDVFIGISDDAINMMFASLTAAGKLQTGAPGGNGCIDTGVTIGTLLPPSCDSLTLDNDVSTVAARGYCHAIKGDACGSVTYNNPALSATDNANLTASEQGECYGAQGLPAGQTCGSLANFNLFFYGACSITPNLNLHAPQPLLFCAKGDVPPRMLFPDNPGTGGAVPAVLRIPSLSVALVIDRDQNHQTTGAFANIPGCFTPGTSTAVDCNVFSACLALNLDFSMAFQTCSDGKPGFVPTFQDVQVLTRQVGTVCGGATSPTTDASVLSSSSNTQITIPLGNNGASFAPPICGAGLDLGGFVSCTQPGVLSIRSENTFLDSRDYLAITCKIQ